MTLQHQFHRFARRRELRVTQRSLAKERRVTGGFQQGVARAQWHVETFGEMHHHLTARQRAARFDEAQMACGDVGFGREQQLAHPAPLSPVAQQFADRAAGRRTGRRGGLGMVECAHADDHSESTRVIHYLAGKGQWNGETERSNQRDQAST